MLSVNYSNSDVQFNNRNDINVYKYVIGHVHMTQSVFVRISVQFAGFALTS